MGRAYWSRIVEVRDRGGFDYLDFDLEGPDDLSLPASYEGMSGAGLWLVRKGALDSPLLIGVAFYQSSDRRFIRCHGPKSLDKLLRRATE